jgi:hypothetical protein
MRTRIVRSRRALSTLLLIALAGLRPALGFAQAPTRSSEGAPRAEGTRSTATEEDARETRERLREVLNQYAPSTAQVLRLDPSLLTRPDYVASYPRLAAFLAQHPEVAHNPAFFLGDARFGVPDPRSRPDGVVQNLLGGIAALTVFGTIVGFLVWTIRSVISYRSWQRVLRIQTEAHQKIFDRLTSNDELLAYIQSPGGQRFLASTSMAVDLSPRSMGAPVGRILWSIQAGVVMAIGGIGLFVAKGIVAQDAAQVLYVLSALAIAVGCGFVVSAIVAYALSRRLGLLNSAPRTTHA